MKIIQSNETEITGKWLISKGRIEEDEICQRIRDLTKGCLIEIGHDFSGWETLYRDPNDGRFWELTYPQNELQAGGPPQLLCLPENIAKTKYEKKGVEKGSVP